LSREKIDITLLARRLRWTGQLKGYPNTCLGKCEILGEFPMFSNFKGKGTRVINYGVV
jgi:hypothetical protein